MTTYTLTRRDTGACASVTVERTLGRTAYAICCPWHKEETASCTFSIRSHLFYCFGCNAHGTCHEEMTLAALDAFLGTVPDEDLPEAQIDQIVARVRQAQEGS